MAENNLRSKHLRNNASIWDTEDLILQSTHYKCSITFHFGSTAPTELNYIRKYWVLLQNSLCLLPGFQKRTHTNHFWSLTCLVSHRNFVTEAGIVSNSPAISLTSIVFSSPSRAGWIIELSVWWLKWKRTKRKMGGGIISGQTKPNKFQSSTPSPNHQIF